MRDRPTHCRDIGIYWHCLSHKHLNPLDIACACKYRVAHKSKPPGFNFSLHASSNRPSQYMIEIPYVDEFLSDHCIQRLPHNVIFCSCPILRFGRTSTAAEHRRPCSSDESEVDISLQKSLRLRVWVNFDRITPLLAYMYRLTESDFRFNVIISGWRP